MSTGEPVPGGLVHVWITNRQFAELSLEKWSQITSKLILQWRNGITSGGPIQSIVQGLAVREDSDGLPGNALVLVQRGQDAHAYNTICKWELKTVLTWAWIFCF